MKKLTADNNFSTMQNKIILLALSAFVVSVVSQNHHDHASYKFEYGVQDPHTHDFHAQKEHRDGKNVVGEYTLHDPDGTQRVVKYVSGPHTGFEAIVERKGHAQHPAHYGKHGNGEKGGVGGTSYVGITHWSNQGAEHGH